MAEFVRFPNVDDVADAIAEALIFQGLDWDNQDESGNPTELDREGFTIDDFDEASKARIREIAESFCSTDMLELISDSGLTDEQIGHDIVFSANGHGTGFWDRGIGEIGEKLHEIAKPYGSLDIYVNADRKSLHLEG